MGRGAGSLRPFTIWILCESCGKLPLDKNLGWTILALDLTIPR